VTGQEAGQWDRLYAMQQRAEQAEAELVQAVAERDAVPWKASYKWMCRQRDQAVAERDRYLEQVRDGIGQDAEWAKDCLVDGGAVAGRSTDARDRALSYIERIIERAAALAVSTP
jgi:hypothetical protein